MGSDGFRPSSLLDGQGCMSVAHLESFGTRKYSLSEMAYVEDLAKKLAAFGLLHPNCNRPSLFTSATTGSSGKLVGRCPCAACIKPNFEYSSKGDAMVRLSEMEYGYGGGTSFKGNLVGQNEVWGGWDLVSVGRTEPLFHRHDFRNFSPVMSQVATCTERPKVTPRREIPSQTLVHTNRPVGMRKCKGTGVFLPRIAGTKEIGTYPGMMGIGNRRLHTPQQHGLRHLELRVVDADNKVTSCHGRTPPEPVLVLPQDWTY